MRQQVRTGRVQTPNMAELNLDYDAKTRLVSGVVLPCRGMGQPAAAWDGLSTQAAHSGWRGVGRQHGKLPPHVWWGQVHSATYAAQASIL